MTAILHFMGPTCAGKSTIIDALVQYAPEIVYPLQIGKALRAKYGEAYFQGQAAPEKTREEAIQMYRECIAEAKEQGYEIIVVDGQPRDVSQALEMAASHKNDRNEFWLIHASHEIREERARLGRAPGPDLDLAVARLTNDYKNNYLVLAELLQKGIDINVVDTGDDFFYANDFAQLLLEKYSDWEMGDE